METGMGQNNEKRNARPPLTPGQIDAAKNLIATSNPDTSFDEFSPDLQSLVDDYVEHVAQEQKIEPTDAVLQLFAGTPYDNLTPKMRELMDSLKNNVPKRADGNTMQ